MIRRYLPVVLVFLVIWVVTVEVLSWFVVLSGIGVAVVALVLTNRLLGIDYATVFLSPLATLRYALVLLKEIATAAWGMAAIILRGRAQATYFEHESALTDDLLLFLLANSIILTPGSVAVDREGSRITVITADDDVERARAACLRLERSIARLRSGGSACS
ncbi:Na+/H+ antiporter subunit E [Xylanimonas sp. McL0601]|uniref:Na+/H+ antiporter subunit E n=1 Tax=Xylanimonas sp. McL0601 TaxID=3414739 RepID=UPI003CF19A19